jgi:creatinine amidohydrolase/Fe(II)-dependent formamide hydrolase-like protein
MSQSVAGKFIYADLTWPEVNEAVEMGKAILLPVGSTEQHGHHLPLDVDNLLSTSICLEAGRRAPELKVSIENGLSNKSSSQAWS